MISAKGRVTPWSLRRKDLWLEQLDRASERTWYLVWAQRRSEQDSDFSLQCLKCRPRDTLITLHRLSYLFFKGFAPFTEQAQCDIFPNVLRHDWLGYFPSFEFYRYRIIRTHTTGIFIFANSFF